MLISWEALAFVFAIMPVIVVLAYCYECGVKGERPSPSGYLKLLKIAEKAKKESYRQTAEIFQDEKSPVFFVGMLAWLFSLIVSLLSPGSLEVLACFVVAIPTSFIAYIIGRCHRGRGTK